MLYGYVQNADIRTADRLTDTIPFVSAFFILGGQRKPLENGGKMRKNIEIKNMKDCRLATIAVYNSAHFRHYILLNKLCYNREKSNVVNRSEL